MSNLVVFRDRTGPPGADVDAVTSDLPRSAARRGSPATIRALIVLDHERADRRRPTWPFAAGVGILTFGPPDARYGVEQIVVAVCVRRGVAAVDRPPLRARRLPTTVWWTEDLSRVPPLGAARDDGPAAALRQPRLARRPRAACARSAPLVGSGHAGSRRPELAAAGAAPSGARPREPRRARKRRRPAARCERAHRASRRATRRWRGCWRARLMAEQKKPAGQMPPRRRIGAGRHGAADDHAPRLERDHGHPRRASAWSSKMAPASRWSSACR